MYWTVSNNLCLTFFLLLQRHLEAGRIKKAKLQKLPKKDNSISVKIVSWTEEILKKRFVLSFQTTILTISLSDPHNDILTGTRVCYLSTRKGFIVRWCKSTKNTRLGYKVCVKKSKARFDLEKKTPSTKCSNVKVWHQKVIYCLAWI